MAFKFFQFPLPFRARQTLKLERQKDFTIGMPAEQSKRQSPSAYPNVNLLRSEVDAIQRKN